MFHSLTGAVAMKKRGIIEVRAERLSQAVLRVEELGCAILDARPTTTDGEFACEVIMPGASAYVVAYAVARNEITFKRLD